MRLPPLFLAAALSGAAPAALAAQTPSDLRPSPEAGTDRTAPNPPPAGHAELPPPPGAAPPPATIPGWADRCTDFRTIGWGIKAPENFLNLVRVFSEPDIYLEFARRALDPQAYVRVAGTIPEPATAGNFLEWGDPRIYLKWAAAFLDPGFYGHLMAIFMDPGKPVRWAMAPSDPRTVEIMATAANPATAVGWMAAPLRAESWAPVTKALNPDTFAAWGRVLEDPHHRSDTGAALATAPDGPAPGECQSGVIC